MTPYLLIRANKQIVRAAPGTIRDDVIVTSSLEEAIEAAKKLESEEIHIGGGAEIYKQALPLIDKLYLTMIDAEDPSADAFFPPYESEFTRKVFEEELEWNGLKYRWIDLERE